jgi:hypothetical protein
VGLIRGTDLLVGGFAALAIVLVATTTAFFVLRRLMRRRWSRLGAEAGVVAAMTFVRVAARMLSTWRRGMPTMAPSAGEARRGRRAMWRAVGAAERAVRHARAGTAPIAELPALCSRLRSVAEVLDRSLLISSRGSTVGFDRREVDDLVRTAQEIERAAASSLREITVPLARGLADDARRETQALEAGLGQLRKLHFGPEG